MPQYLDVGQLISNIFLNKLDGYVEEMFIHSTDDTE